MGSRYSIFGKPEIEVSLKSEENNTIDAVVEELGDLRRELIIDRKAREAFDYGQPVEGNDEVDLEDVPPKEVENG